MSNKYENQGYQSSAPHPPYAPSYGYPQFNYQPQDQNIPIELEDPSVLYGNAPLLSDELDRLIRMVFIRNVYLILIGMILWTASIVSICYLVQSIFDFLQENWWIFWISVGIYFITFIVLICVNEVAKTFPWNYLFLTIFTTAVGFMLGTSIPGRYDGTYALICLGITFLITVSVSIFACQTKYDFTTKGGILFVALICLLFLMILQFFFRDQIFGLLISIFGTFLFTAYIIYDTQLIVGGNHRKYQLHTDEHIFGAMLLYIDVLNLFLFILNLGNSSNND